MIINTRTYKELFPSNQGKQLFLKSRDFSDFLFLEIWSLNLFRLSFISNLTPYIVHIRKMVHLRSKCTIWRLLHKLLEPVKRADFKYVFAV